jgi:hypothetical protein
MRQILSFYMAPAAACTISDGQADVFASVCTDSHTSNDETFLIDYAASSWKPPLPRTFWDNVMFT